MNEDRPSPNYKSARECAIDEQAYECDEYEEYDDYDFDGEFKTQRDAQREANYYTQQTGNAAYVSKEQL